jgi:co-chaperonin GroES (HSP10)
MNKKEMKIYPRLNWVLVKPEDKKGTEDTHGFIIPDSVEQEQKSYGVVLEVGSAIKDIKRGDIAVYGFAAGETVKIMDKGKEVEYKLVYDDDIIAFLK